ncbi:MAG: hypothetical protein GY757_23540, partial [bacterium]|nr:hypothetical protein [bacterium]
FFEKKYLENLDWKKIQEIGDHIHAFKTVALAKGNALGEPNYPIEHYKDVFLQLAHGPGSDKERIARNYTPLT